MLRKSFRKLFCRLPCIILPMLAIGLAYGLDLKAPMIVLLIPVIYFTYYQGTLSGALSAAAAFFYLLLFLSEPGEPFSFSQADLYSMPVALACLIITVLLVAAMKKHSDRQARAAERLNNNFMNILSNLDLQLLVTEPRTGIILFANRAMNAAYGITDDPQGKKCWEIYYGKNRRCEFCPVFRLIKKPGEPIDWELQDKASGRWFLNHETMIEWPDGRTVHLQQGQEITLEKKMRRELLEAKEQAEKGSRAKSEFLSSMSHEIRTPMNAIVGMTQIARRVDNPRSTNDCLNRIDDAAAHLLGVINDILDVSKIEAGKFVLSESDFLLEHMFTRIANLNNFRFGQKQQNFSIIASPDTPVAIIADRQRLVQVITNLLSNATKFTSNKGSITLSVNVEREEGEHIILRFAVRDSGIGMTQEQQSRLFRSFEQADGSISKRFGGTGLGLAISKNIVEMMGGSIWVESELGKGSCFIFTLRAKRGTAARACHLNPDIDWSNTRILAVMKTEQGRNYFKILTDSLCIHSDVAASGEEALSLLRHGVYEVVIVDVGMEEHIPFEISRMVRAECPGQRIVLLAFSKDWADIEKEAALLNIQHHIPKPLLPSPFIDCLNRCLVGAKTTQRAGMYEGFRQADADIFLGRRMLLVEDMEVNREIVKGLLEATGVEIIEAENGRAACRIYEEFQGAFDIIFMDIQMPEMNGYAAAEVIRKMTDISGATTIPIVAMTADVFQEDIERCIKAGMTGHIGKPITAQGLLDILKTHLPVRENTL